MLEDLAAEMKQEQDRNEKISSSAVQSYGVNPDQHAGNVKLARKAGMPPALMPEINEDARLRVLLDQIDSAPPAVTRFVSDPENLKLSHDDLDNMSALERTFDVLKKAGRSLASTPWTASSGLSGVLQAMGEVDDAISRPLKDLWQTVSGVEPQEGALTRYAKSIRSGAKVTAEDIKGDTTGAGIFERGLYSGIESLGQNLLTLPLTIMTGSAAPMLTSMTAMSGGEGYGTARDKGKGIAQSLIYGGNQAGIEYLTEVAPALLLVKNLKAKTGLMKFGRDMLASEVPNEQYATALQDLNEWAVLNPEKPFTSYLAERPAAMVETLIATIVGTGGMVVTAKGLEKIGASVDKFQTATDNRDFLLALGDGVQASKLRERMPEKMQELIRSMKEEHGTPEHAYVDANKLTELWQSNGFDPQKKAAEMFSDPSGYAEALVTGSEVAIPLEEFAQKFTGEEYYKALIEDVRLGAGASTMREADEWNDLYNEPEIPSMKPEHEQAVIELVNQWQRENKTTWGDNLFEGSALSNAAFDDVDGFSLQAHGMAKTSPAQAIKDLLNLFKNGISQDRGGNAGENSNEKGMLYSANLTSYKGDAGGVGSGSGVGTAGGVAYRDGAFILVAREGVKSIRDINDIAGVLVNPAMGSDVVTSLQAALPDGVLVKSYHDVSSIVSHAKQKQETGRKSNSRKQEIKDLIAEAEGIAPTPSDLKIYDDVVGQLIGTGMERGTAERNALVMKSVFRTLGARTGQDAYDLYKEYGLKITRPLPGALSKRLSVDLSLDPILDRLREGKIPQDKDVRGKSLTEYLRKQGVKDSGGELAALDPDSGIKGKAKKLIKADGLEMDRARLVAIEDGYLPEGATIRDFLDAISNDLAGRGVYSNNNLNNQLMDEQLSLTQMKEFLDAHDIDIQGMTNEEIKAALQETQVSDAQEMNQPGSAAFDKWFGDSKVVDENGNPLVVYRGGVKGKNILDGNTYFTDTPEGAGWYGKGKGKSVEPYYLMMKNPLIVEYDGQDDSEMHFDIQKAQEEGYDGLIVKEADDGKQIINQYVTFSPTQIKSAIGNNGNFDSQDANILHQSNNASGESSASLEALGVEKTRKNQGIKHLIIDTRSNKSRPAIGPSPEDNALNPYDVLVQVKDDKAILVNKGSKAITTLFQKSDQKRAFIRFGTDRQFNIGFLENADLSSFSHESAHLYFEVLADLAGKENAPQQIRDDFQILLTYSGYGTEENRQALNAEGQAIQSAAKGRELTEEEIARLNEISAPHEVIARSFEAYLMEGKAPSVELQSVFSRMKAWLVQVYKEIRKLNVKLNDDVRGVFDRLVASDEEIEAARTRQGLKEVFATAEDMGVSEAEFQIYRKQGEKVHAAQIEKLEKEYLAEMTRLNQQWWNDGLAKMAAEVSGETEDYPVYIAIQVLTKGITFAGEVADLKLDRKTLEKQYGKTLVKRLPRGIFGKEGGLSADQVAEMTGFESGQEMIEAMITAPSRKEFVKAEADRRMRALHGDLLTDGSAADEATLAVHTDEQAKVLHEELRAMRKLQVTADKITRAKDSDTRAEKKATIGAIPPAEFFKDLARDMVAKKMIEELLPHRYQQAEAKAAREAFEAAGKKDWAKAAEAKQRQILNHYLYKEAANIKKMVDKQVGKWNELIKKSDKRLAASRDMNIVTAARAVLAAYGIGDSPDKALAALAQVQQYDPNLYESLQMAVDVATQEPKPWKKLQLTEFIGLMDAVNNLWHLSKRSKVAMIDGLAVGLDEINDDLHLQIGGRARPFAGLGKTSAVTDLQKLKIGFLGMGAALKRVEHWTVEMDRGDSGPFHDFILRPIYNAVTQYKAEKKPVIEKLREIFSRLDSDVFSDKKIAAPELGYTFKNKGELLHAILHTGNESNLKKLLVGRNWADAENEQRALDRSRWDAFLDRMHKDGVLTEADYVFAQEVWDLLESTKSGAQKAHHDMYGYYFAEITAEPVVTPFGTFRGGYVPAITDPYLVESAAERADQENLLQDNASSMFPATTGKGFTMSRVAGYNKPLLLDLGLMATHVDKVLRFSTMGPAIQDVGRILNNSELKETFAEINPAWSSEMLVPWLKRTARQTVETKSSGWGGKASDAVFRGLRRRAGLQLMAANIANATQQLTGLFPAMAKVSPRKMGAALVQFTRNPFELTREITGKSKWMADRLDNEISQISGELRDILTQSKYEKAQDFGMRAGYWASGAAQHIVDVITWQAAYDEKIAEGEDEKESVQYADSVVRQTQGSFAPEDASSFEAKSPFVRLFTQFYSYFNMISNLAVTESRNAIAEMGWKGGSPRLFYIYMMTFALPSFLSQLIMAAMRGKIDEDEDGEYIDDVMMMFFTGQGRAATALIPGAGQIINTAVNRFNKNPTDDRMSVSASVGTLEQMGSVPKDLYDVLLDGKELKRAHVRDVFTLAGMVTGLPFAAAARPLGYMVAEESGATEPANNIDYIRGLMTGYAPK